MTEILKFIPITYNPKKLIEELRVLSSDFIIYWDGFLQDENGNRSPDQTTANPGQIRIKFFNNLLNQQNLLANVILKTHSYLNQSVEQVSIEKDSTELDELESLYNSVNHWDDKDKNRILEILSRIVLRSNTVNLP